MHVADAILQEAAGRVAGRSLPEATYRVQFHAGFTFADARAIVGYLHQLGITHLYASPYLKARPGSRHGYDIIDHGSLNPEVGSEQEFDSLVAELHAHGMGQILDMVPNHMGISGNHNAWWNDVLENGPSSPYAGYFDIAWQDSPRPELNNRVLLPVLGEPYGKALEAQQIRLAYADGAFTIHYFEHCFPVTPPSYAMILSQDFDELKRLIESETGPWSEYQSILTAVSHLPRFGETDPAKVAELLREKEVIKRRLAALTEACPPVRASIEKTVALFNGVAGAPHSFDLLDKLLDEQAYRLSYWRVAADEINYRRFFDVNDLAALSMEKIEVFLATHALVLKLLSEGKIDGLRIDHPDGLFDPKQYLRRLQQHYRLAEGRQVFETDPKYRGTEWKEIEAPLLERIEATPERDALYVVVEKILAPSEDLPADWATHGTSGYGFLNVVNALFIDPLGEEPLTQLYRNWTHTDMQLPDLIYSKKSLVLRDTLSSELHMLGRQLDRLAQKSRHSRDFTGNSLRFALREVIAFFSVYRSYIADGEVHDFDRRYAALAVSRSMRHNPTVSVALFRFVRDMLLLVYPESAHEEDKAEQRRFAGKFQQVTAPVMAKGLEDTTFYIYNRLLSLNEVGGLPSRFGVAPEGVHQFLAARQTRWPHALSPLSTHDTKRSEDVRARINVLSELSQEWGDAVERWRKLNAPHRTNVDDAPAPDANEEYMLFQTLIGAWPLEPCSPAEYAGFIERIQAYMLKALREAKVHTSWINPDESYDEAVRNYVARILDENTSAAFLADLRTFERRISHFGMLNALAQTLLKIASPGAPDIYQGTELWDFSLVDPDNRRPVDFERRRQALAELDASLGKDRRAQVRELLKSWQDGRVKLYVTAQGLRCRRDHPGLFSSGEYVPLSLEGSMKDHAFAFARRYQETMAIAVVPRLMTRLETKPFSLPIGKEVWENTRLLLPDGQRVLSWHNVFTGHSVSAPARQERIAVPLAQIFADFPVALLMAGPAQQ